MTEPQRAELPSPRPKSRWPWIVGCAAAVVAAGTLGFIAIGAKGSAPPPPAAPVTSPVSVAVAAPTFTMTGAFDVFVDPASTTLAVGAACKGSGASSDISDATVVNVFDPQGKLIATGGLSNGTYQSTPIGSACVFTLSVDGVPDGLPNYSVEIGRRGERSINSTYAHGHVFMSDGP
jgi:hypothetical protein